jgi:hypothetical protein
METGLEMGFLGAMFLVGGLAGFVDSIAGGGGLIALPALLAAGVPPHQALATNKLQSSFGSLTATLNYARHGLVRARHVLTGIMATLAGAAGGAAAVQLFPAGWLRDVVIGLLVVMFVYNLARPRLGMQEGRARVPAGPFHVFFGLLLGFYDGFFGPGTGSFWTMALVLLLGLDLKAATARTKIFNFTSNIVALVVFVHAGLVVWPLGLAMGAGQMLGALAGSGLVKRRNVSFIRPFFLTVVAATILKLVWDRLGS